MPDNQQYLTEARAKAAAFDAEREPERLREAYEALENVVPAQEGNPAARAAVRRDGLALWLRLLHTLDQNLDPAFDPADVPATKVQPPPIPGGGVPPPGADPATIPDPKARAEYQKAVAANRAKAENYRLQNLLRQMDERIAPRAEGFIRTAFAPDAADRAEVAAAVGAVVKNAARKAKLLKLVTPD